MNIFEQEDKIISDLKTNCKQILHAYETTSEYFYRGMDVDKPYIFDSYPTNRQPRDSKKQAHDYMNKILLTAGFKTNRSNSIAATKDVKQASEYGNTFIVLPYDGSYYCWSSLTEDWGDIVNLERISMSFITYIQDVAEKDDRYTEAAEKLQNMVLEKGSVPIRKIMNILAKNPKLEKDFHKKFVKYQQISETKNPSKLLSDFSGEVMITGDRYYTFEINYYFKNIQPLLW